jgi:asparagine synthase (glutamine-hydrolysing)
LGGIAGLVLCDGRAVTPPLLDRIVAQFPSSSGTTDTAIGIWCSGAAGLIHAPLAATPEAFRETQPFASQRSGAIICFDGRLDNRDELLARLPEGRSQLAEASDCAIALALFEHQGESFLDELVGDFALAIWQPKTQRLFCARSPLGWRPFLWTFDGKTFGFATEPRPLIEGLGLPRRANEGAIGEYLALRFVTQTETFWEGINRLPQGAALSLQNGRVRTWHWHKGPFEDLVDLSDDEHIERFRILFDQALIGCMRSATPVASHLSGGLDSSSIVCRLTELHRAGRVGSQVRPISARFPGEPHDETEWSSAVEAHLGIDARVVTPRDYDWDTAGAWCAETLHLPLRPNALGVTIAVCDRLRRDGIRVLLSGEGGDDWMLGSHAHWPDLLLGGRWLRLAREGLRQGPRWSFRGQLKSVVMESAGPILLKTQREQLLRPHLRFTGALPSWIDPAWARRIGLAERWRADALAVALPGFAQKTRYQVFALARRHVNFDNVLAYVNREGIELRHPFHDRRLTHFFMGAAGGVMMRDGWRKHLLREAMRGTLPEKVRTRRSKANFAVPGIEAVAQRFRERAPSELMPVKLGWVDGREIARAHDTYVAWQRAGAQPPVPDVSYGLVWGAVAIDLWLEHALRV